MISIDFSSDSLIDKFSEGERFVQDKLGNDTYQKLHVMCGDSFFDSLRKAAEVTDSYERLDSNSFARNSFVRSAFAWHGHVFENYRGKVGSVEFIPTEDARVIPMGASIFRRYNGPDTTLKNAGKMGKPVTFTQEFLAHDEGIEIKAQANPLFLPVRPGALLVYRKDWLMSDPFTQTYNTIWSSVEKHEGLTELVRLGNRIKL